MGKIENWWKIGWKIKNCLKSKLEEKCFFLYNLKTPSKLVYKIVTIITNSNCQYGHAWDPVIEIDQEIIVVFVIFVAVKAHIFLLYKWNKHTVTKVHILSQKSCFFKILIFDFLRLIYYLQIRVGWISKILSTFFVKIIFWTEIGLFMRKKAHIFLLYK